MLCQILFIHSYMNMHMLPSVFILKLDFFGLVVCHTRQNMYCSYKNAFSTLSQFTWDNWIDFILKITYQHTLFQVHSFQIWTCLKKIEEKGSYELFIEWEFCFSVSYHVIIKTSMSNHRPSSTGIQKSIPIQKKNQLQLNICVYRWSSVVLLDMNR